MSKWILKGIQTRINKTVYARRKNKTEGISPGFPSVKKSCLLHTPSAASFCPTEALRYENGETIFDCGRCVHCFRCVRHVSGNVGWDYDYEWTVRLKNFDDPKQNTVTKNGSFFHFLFFDGGACEACLSEIKQIGTSYYDIRRIGFSSTRNAAEAHLIIIAGPVPEHLRIPLRNIYETMPASKKVLAMGACALSGGIFNASQASTSTLADLIPIDIGIPGCPPPPLAIVHGLRLAVSREK